MKFKIPSENKDKRAAAFHEAGHALVLHHFGYHWEANLIRVGDPTAQNMAWGGQVRSLGLRVQATTFRVSVIGWAGPVAEYLAFGDRDGERPPTQWGEVCVFDFWDYMINCGIDELSATDQEWIRGDSRLWRTLNTAWNICLKRSDLLLKIVDQLEHRGFSDSILV